MKNSHVTMHLYDVHVSVQLMGTITQPPRSQMTIRHFRIQNRKYIKNLQAVELPKNDGFNKKLSGLAVV